LRSEVNTNTMTTVFMVVNGV